MAERTPYDIEQSVLRLIVHGDTYPKISTKLDISVSTIKKIRKRV